MNRPTNRLSKLSRFNRRASTNISKERKELRQAFVIDKNDDVELALVVLGIVSLGIIALFLWRTM